MWNALESTWDQWAKGMHSNPDGISHPLQKIWTLRYTDSQENIEIMFYGFRYVSGFRHCL